MGEPNTKSLKTLEAARESMGVDAPRFGLKNEAVGAPPFLRKHKGEDVKKKMYIRVTEEYGSSAWYMLDLEEDGKFNKMEWPKPVPYIPQSTAVAVGSKIYLIGGVDPQNTETYRADVCYFDTNSSSSSSDNDNFNWRSALPLEVGALKPDAVSVDGKIFVSGSSYLIFVFFDGSNWAHLPGPPINPSFSRHFPPAIPDPANNRIIVCFSWSIDHESSSLFAYYPAEEVPSERWKPVSIYFPGNNGMWYNKSVVADNVIYFHKTDTANIYAYDLAKSKWVDVNWSNPPEKHLFSLKMDWDWEGFLYLGNGVLCLTRHLPNLVQCLTFTVAQTDDGEISASASPVKRFTIPDADTVEDYLLL